MAHAKVKVLIVEDEALFALSLRTVLKRMGYDVCEMVSTGKEAFAIVEKESPDLIIMDVLLNGEMNGIDTAIKIRTKYNMPILFVTGYLDEDVLVQIEALERTRYVSKPLNTDTMVKHVKAVLAL